MSQKIILLSKMNKYLFKNSINYKKKKAVFITASQDKINKYPCQKRKYDNIAKIKAKMTPAQDDFQCS